METRLAAVRRTCWIALLTLLIAYVSRARADEVRVAVGANFLGTLEKLAPLYHKESGHRLVISAGSSGQLFAQIKAGAPYDVLLSADAERPSQLVNDGLAVAASRFVYATGVLVLWSRDGKRVDAQGKLLGSPSLANVALADPKTAPYGAAAEQVLRKLGHYQRLAAAGKLVLGTSVAQAYQFAASGAAECAFVALSQLQAGAHKGSVWRVPQSLYSELRQEAVLLERAKNSVAARAFLRWLETAPAARTLIRAAGYKLEG